MISLEGKWVLCELTQWSRVLLERLVKAEVSFNYVEPHKNPNGGIKFLILPCYTPAEIIVSSYLFLRSGKKNFRLLLPKSIMKSPIALYVVQRGLKIIDDEEMLKSLFDNLSPDDFIVCFPEAGFVSEEKLFELSLGLSQLDCLSEEVYKELSQLKSLSGCDGDRLTHQVKEISWFLLGLNYLPSRFGKNPFLNICDISYEELASGYLDKIDLSNSLVNERCIIEGVAYNLEVLEVDNIKKALLSLPAYFAPNLERVVLLLLSLSLPLNYSERHLRNKLSFLLNQLKEQYNSDTFRVMSQLIIELSSGESAPQWKHLLSFLNGEGILKPVGDRLYRVKLMKKGGGGIFSKQLSLLPNPIISSLDDKFKFSRKKRFFISMLPNFILSYKLASDFYRKDLQIFEEDYRNNFHSEWTKDSDVGKPFFWHVPGSKIGVVLSHGYLSAPMEVKALGEFLYRSGISVYGVRLKGHGTSPLDLANSKWLEWYESLNRGISALRCLYDKIYLCGFSAGGCLVLYASSRKNQDDISGVISISAPVRLQNYAINLLPTVTTLNYVLKKFGGEGWDLLEHKPENPHINYQKNPLAGLRELKSLMEETEKILPFIKVPTLIIQGSNDNTVNPESADIIYENLGTEKKYKVVFHRNNHGILNGPLASEIFATVRDFLLGG
ncbi:MAG: alpha/beta hydrolase [Candidatus Hydrogenedentes bacterium]|nr:alpha/beta hydrolase [Candidatus Hydrogenedentota bacterium]